MPGDAADVDNYVSAVETTSTTVALANKKQASGDVAGSEALRTHRILLVIAAIGLFSPALIAWSSIIQLPFIGGVSTAACAASLGLVVPAAACRTERGLRRVDLAVLLLGLVLLGSWATTELYFYPAYGTDESAFVQYAADLLMQGHNPYGTNLLPALTEYRVPIEYATYKLNGTIASNLAYPSLSFLLVVPVLLVTHVQAIIAENVLALGAEMVLLYVFLPKTYRALSVIVIAGLPFLFDYTIGGDIVTMSIPFLLFTAYRWTEIGHEGRLRRGGILRAVALGMAASICQFPWFVVPFLAVGLWRLRSRDLGPRQAALLLVRFFLITLSTFFVINLPFIVWSPSAWINGVLSPLFQHAIPFGQGLIDATAFFRIGGGNLFVYTVCAVAIFAAILVAFYQYFDWLWKATFILPSVIFLFSTRSLSEYFIMMVALWVVSLFAADIDTSRGRHRLRRVVEDLAPKRETAPASPRRVTRGAIWRWGLLGLPLLVAVGCIVVAFTSRAPLSITIKSVETNGQLRGIWRIRAQVTNRSTSSLQPHFATDASGYMTTFWNVVAGPKLLGPGQQAIYMLVAPNVGSMPGVTQPFVLQAVTASPDTMSSSTLLTPQRFDCYISPSYVDKVLPIGESVSLNVELRSPYGAPVDEPNVPVALGQVIYGQNALIPSEASINNAPEGQSPVIALTNNKGTATFNIRDSTVQDGNPIYFQAYVDPRNGFPYGYSEVISVQWEAPTR